MKRFLALLTIPFFLPLFLAACGEVAGTSDGDVTIVKNYDETLLAQYRAILPSSAAVEVKAPTASGVRTVGEPAFYPQHAEGIVAGVNGAVKGIIDLMELIVAIEPTFYNSETLEFVWGPWENNDENNDDFGWTMVYIRDNGADTDKDFRYDYALLKGTSNDLATMTPVIWGA
ncbi:hypothetical protein KAI87_05170, partial [Myxococcota bacterium]|nr:hypothetical protein [Myxococcota bacterium]